MILIPPGELSQIAFDTLSETVERLWDLEPGHFEVIKMPEPNWHTQLIASAYREAGNNPFVFGFDELNRRLGGVGTNQIVVCDVIATQQQHSFGCRPDASEIGFSSWLPLKTSCRVVAKVPDGGVEFGQGFPSAYEDELAPVLSANVYTFAPGESVDAQPRFPNFPH